ncbi:MAG: Hsp20/alpha crystallin family protein [Verrucomicrobiaceae bacterium]|jgi:HSP20 family protein|nr:MAG: Hsp20/alpha crystallin family protein [Verrucomicrobiaceae bacterium]RPJ35258.1 MAG: Hsp20/alpha crystallin family protein [Verrucomicrobiaceae bacterium]
MNMNESISTPTAPRAEQAAERPVFVPAADIYETPSELLIRCDMPGIDEKDLEITLENKQLTVTGPQMGQGREACETLVGEYFTGIYQRAFGLGRDLDDSAISARLKDGVLEIKLPKAREAQPRRIPVEV